MYKALLFCLALLSCALIQAQKKVLDHPDFDIWNTIEDPRIARDGSAIVYALKKGEKDQQLKLKNTKGALIFEHERSEKGQFTFDSQYLIFTIKAWQDSVLEMKRRKEKKMPKDTLAIWSLKNKRLTKIPRLQSYKIPEKWSGYIAYQVADTSEKKEKKKKKSDTKPGKAYTLVLKNLSTAQADSFPKVSDYLFAKEGHKLAFTSKGSKKLEAGVYVYDCEEGLLIPILQQTGKYAGLGMSDSGNQLGFVADFDKSKVQIRPHILYHWDGDTAKALVDPANAPEGYLVSSNQKVSFSKDESKLFFGLASPPILKDTSLLPEEIVNVEVWTYHEARLYTVQELQVKDDRKKSYLTAIDLNKGDQLIPIATKEIPDAELGNEGNATHAMASTILPYQLAAQWQGGTDRDIYLIDLVSGDRKKVIEKVRGNFKLSPAAQYIYGYDARDSSWLTYSIAKDQLTRLTKGKVFFDEQNDSPNYPRSYRSAGWTQHDEAFLVYDRYDIWQFDPTLPTSAKRLTKGRENKTIYRYLKLDPEQRFIDTQEPILLSSVDEVGRDEGYHSYDFQSAKLQTLLQGSFHLSRPLKARDSDELLYTKESFELFPDLIHSDLSFKKHRPISQANPQQAEYNWGTAEIVKWTSLDGIPLEGMLIKPEDFDPNKKYPMIVNFYERSSQGIHRHRAPAAGRSTINYSFYSSRGYVIFNPDVVYRIGYPGESAYNCVLPGVTALIQEGFIDEKNIGVQGHSWGGYQIAYLVTKTNIFKAAEAGAPVPNMISAYGGIRWWTGLSRQFQYEHTQSRIGGTLWEYPARFIENSPIFYIDKINTPLLIMHNDADGHVPWYQGIEFFVALRRLGKPSWFLNYNGEPHWPVKRHNRLDFNIRMQQFFDYYLKEAPMPKWMRDGVPAIEKGINQGYELLDK